MTDQYHDGQRELQDRFDTRRLADRLASVAGDTFGEEFTRKSAPSPFVPSAGAEPPVPDWKRDPWFEGTLAAGDPALDPDRPSAPSLPQF
jgi:hypothetical protein